MPRIKKKYLSETVRDFTSEKFDHCDKSFDPAAFDNLATPAVLVQSTDANMAMPQDTQAEAAYETGHRHAARHHRREPVVTPSGLTFHKTDVLAGIKQGEGFRLIDVTNEQGEAIQAKVRDAVLRFDEKPSPEVTATLKDAGFRWQPEPKLWTRPVKRDTAWQDRAHADATFEVVSRQVRTERNIAHGYGQAVV